jgi:predicted flap endonuclease-1-like 5' DNA nuclease
MADERRFTVICDNVFHRGPAGGLDFAPDHGSGTSRAEVSRAEAKQLLEDDPEAYRCPELAEAGDDDPEETDGTALRDVKGIGKKTAPDLEYAGVESVEALAEADVETLAEKVGQSAGVVETWQENARALLG